MENLELVFIPSPGVGHLVATIQLAKHLIHRHDRLSAKILCMKFPSTPFADEYTKTLVVSESQIQLVELPEADSPPPEQFISKVKYIYAFIESYIPHVRNTLNNIILSTNSNSDSPRVAGLVLSFFCLPMMEVANELGLPSYLTLASGTAFLSLMLSLPALHDKFSSEFTDTVPDQVSLPGFPNPIPISVLPPRIFNMQDDAHNVALELAPRFRNPKGVIVNSFVELESRIVNALSDGETPPIYMVGPVLDLKGNSHPNLDQTRCENIMKWLDEQPPCSVLFLCFGSMGSFGASQVKEITIGLEHSGYRFLWSLNTPQQSDENPGEILPVGFEERIGKRGMICKGWTPQVEILGHKAIGGFVSHCGWNSILESLWHGVPIATLPLFAEQPLNAFTMVKEMGLAVEIRMDYREVGGVKLLMDSESSSEVRKKVEEMKIMARKAVEEGGSSFVALGELIKDIIGSK
ncbi:hypothetical protein UlMin_013209 [Ulmus minor]